MKKIILFSLIAVAILSFSFVSSTTRTSEVITIRAVIVIGGFKDSSTIKVYKAGGAPVVIQLGKVSNQETFDPAFTKITETVNTYVNEGYELVSATEYGGGVSVINTYALKK